MKKFELAIAAAAMAVTATPVLAGPPRHAPAHGERAKDRAAIYDSRGYYVAPRRITRDSYIWHGKDRKYYCKRDECTTGLIIGAGVGALAGHELAGGGDKTLGALLGAAVGGVLGRAIHRGDLQCR